MSIGDRLKRHAAVAWCVLAVVFSPLSSRAADPYEIYVVVSLSGPSTFAGHAQAAALAAVEPVINRAGGINGRPIKFVVRDDESNPQVALQLISEIQANAKVPFILGPGTVSSCNAAFPLVVKTGPMIYCMSTSATVTPGGYGFITAPTTPYIITAGIRYLRLKGWTRVALITVNDATGQIYDSAVVATLALPENKGMQLVAHEHYNAGDFDVNAQIAKIKATNPQVLVVGSAGTATGNVLHAIRDVGLQVPVATGSGNASYAQMVQYEKFLPSRLYFFTFWSILSLLPNDVPDRQVRAALQTYATALEAAGIHPDAQQSSAWDPALIMVSALRKLGTNVTPAQVRDYVATVHGFVGANGRYDFTTLPLRGSDDSQSIVALWDGQNHRWLAASRAGGVPIPDR